MLDTGKDKNKTEHRSKASIHEGRAFVSLYKRTFQVRRCNCAGEGGVQLALLRLGLCPGAREAAEYGPCRPAPTPSLSRVSGHGLSTCSYFPLGYNPALLRVSINPRTVPGLPPGLQDGRGGDRPPHPGPQDGVKSSGAQRKAFRVHTGTGSRQANRRHGHACASPVCLVVGDLHPPSSTFLKKNSGKTPAALNTCLSFLLSSLEVLTTNSSRTEKEEEEEEGPGNPHDEEGPVSHRGVADASC